MVDDIEVETARRIFLTGKVPMGPEAIRRQNPLDQAVRPKKSPAPFCHAISKEVRRQLREAYRIFVAAYRQASAELRAGNRIGTHDSRKAASRRLSRSSAVMVCRPVVTVLTSLRVDVSRQPDPIDPQLTSEPRSSKPKK